MRFRTLKTFAVTVLSVGVLAVGAPASHADTGWGKTDTGWGKQDTGWGKI